MLSIPGYHLSHILHQGRYFVVYRARRLQDDKAVVIKSPHTSLETEILCRRLQHEYELLQKFTHENIIHSYELLSTGEKVVLILEDFDGISLKKLIQNKSLNIDRFLQIALHIIHGLLEIHRKNILHRDLKPDNIIVNESCQRVAIIDFSAAMTLAEIAQVTQYTHLSGGTLLYMAPEQTGRVGHPIGFYSDLYSLGMTFYEILCGRPPFDFQDLMQLIHAHIAITPEPPHIINPDVPPAISHIIMKLLAKSPEDRYQSAYGVQLDLQMCQEQWHKHARIVDFPLATYEKTSPVNIPDKLYGQEPQLHHLLSIYQNVPDGGGKLVLLTGAPGIGKSAWIHYLQGEIAKQGGMTISGKFHSLQRSSPYEPLVMGLQTWIRQRLMEPDEVLAKWRAKLQTALHSNASILVEILPELELIIGTSTPSLKFPPNEREQRFYEAFYSLLALISDENPPLVVLLDDLHNCDVATLKLLQHLIHRSKMGTLLLIASLRAPHTNYKVEEMLESLQTNQIPLIRHEILPLTLADIRQLITDSFFTDIDSPMELATWLLQKTDGNPLILRVLLMNLVEQGIFTYHKHKNQWTWEIPQLEQLPSPNNIVDILIQRIVTLDHKTLQTLKYASCMGLSFLAHDLAAITQQPIHQIIKHLQMAMDKGILLRRINVEKTVDPQIESYHFSHERIEQAIYALLSSREKQRNHFIIGRYYQSLASHSTSEQIFYIVKHLNIASELFRNQADRIELATLNLQAGIKAKSAIVYDDAIDFLRKGLAILPTNRWQACHELSFSLHLELMEAAYLSGSVEEGIDLIKPLLSHAKSLIERSKIFALKATLETSQSRHEDAVNTILTGIADFGIRLPPKLNKYHIFMAMTKIHIQTRVLTITKIHQLPQVNDPQKNAFVNLFSLAFAPSAFIPNSLLVAYVPLRIVDFTLREGLTSASASGFIGYALTLIGLFSAHRRAFRFGKLAVSLSKRLSPPWIQSQVNILFYAYIYPWVKSFHQAKAMLEQNYQEALRVGESNHAAYMIVNILIISLFEEQGIEQVLQRVDAILGLAQYKKNKELPRMLQVLKHSWAIFSSSDRTLDLKKATSELAQSSFSNTIKHEGTANTRSYFYLFLAMLFYHCKDYQKAKACIYAQDIQNRMKSWIFSPHYVMVYFYKCLILCQLMTDRKPSSKQDRILIRNLKKMQNLAVSCPENFEARYFIAKAEFERIHLQHDQAMASYHRAIQAAQKYYSKHMEALAFELAARFLLTKNQETIASFYLQAAQNAYRTWGAMAKANFLAHEFPEHFARKVTSSNYGTSTSDESIAGSTSGQHVFDIYTLIKTSQTISSEIVFEKLIHKLMQIVLENAGARRGVLILKTDDAMYVEAESQIEGEYHDTLQTIPLANYELLPHGMIKWVERTRSEIVFNDAIKECADIDMPYIQQYHIRSILCMPIIHKKECVGILYLEHDLSPYIFTNTHVILLRQLAAQIAISVTNARLYRNLDQARKAAELADELKTKFLLTMSHELRTPLNVITGYTDLAEEDLNNEELSSVYQDLENIRKASARLTRTLSNILEFAKLETGLYEIRPTVCDLRQLCHELGEEMQPMLQKNHTTLELSFLSSFDTVTCDRFMLTYCLRSVLENAYAFTRAGHIRFEIRERREQEQSWVEFSISDTGVGMAENEIQKIFSGFRQIDNSVTRTHEGAGLSLAITKRFCDLLGGTLSINSSLGAGTHVTIRLPNLPPPSTNTDMNTSEQYVDSHA